MEVRAVDYVMYYVSDLKKSIDFYQNVLGLKLHDEPGESWAEFNAGNVTFDIGTYDKEMVGKSSGVGFGVKDVKAAVEELKQKGVKIAMDIYETPVCWFAAIEDPDGNKITLHQRKDGTSG